MTPKLQKHGAKGIALTPTNIALVAAGVLVLVVALVALPMMMSSRPGFFARYHTLSRSYETLQTSSHSNIPCNECHVDPRGSVAFKVAATGDFYRGMLKGQKNTAFVKFDKPTNAACLKCHEGEWSNDSERTSKVPHPAHMRVASETRECVQCHKWTAHEETYMQKHKKMPFSGVCVAYGCHVGTKAKQECSSCHHSLDKTDAAWKLNHPQTVRNVGANGCLETCHTANQCRECHTTGKTPKFTGLATQQGMQAIEALHVKSTWINQHGTEALKDQSKCLTCHVSEGECRDCHSKRPAFHGPQSSWIGTHKNFAKDERRCLACHEKTWCKACHDQFKEMR